MLVALSEIFEVDNSRYDTRVTELLIVGYVFFFFFLPRREMLAGVHDITVAIPVTPDA